MIDTLSPQSISVKGVMHARDVPIRKRYQFATYYIRAAVESLWLDHFSHVIDIISILRILIRSMHDGSVHKFYAIIGVAYLWSLLLLQSGFIRCSLVLLSLTEEIMIVSSCRSRAC